MTLPFFPFDISDGQIEAGNETEHGNGIGGDKGDGDGDGDGDGGDGTIRFGVASPKHLLQFLVLFLALPTGKNLGCCQCLGRRASRAAAQQLGLLVRLPSSVPFCTASHKHFPCLWFPSRALSPLPPLHSSSSTPLSSPAQS